MKTERYAFFLDIDGTLWRRGDIPQDNKDTIKKVRSMGHAVLINTGRSLGFIPQSLFDEIELDGVVSGIGASVIVDGEYVEKTFFTEDEIGRVLDFFSDRDNLIILEGEERVIYFKRSDAPKSPFHSKSVSQTANISAREEWDEYYKNEPITKITVHAFIPNEKEIKALSSNFSVIAHPEENYTEIGIRGFDKGVGMLKAAERLGIDQKHCVAMGDSPNDTAMLEAAGISVAMGDAAESVKQMSDIISLPCMEGGVAHAMKQILGI